MNQIVKSYYIKLAKELNRQITITGNYVNGIKVNENQLDSKAIDAIKGINMKKIKVACVDFDGTINDRGNQKGMFLEPFDGAQDALKWFRRWGYSIVIYSARAVDPVMIGKIRDWLKLYSMPFDDITNIKPRKIDFLIDDKAITFNNNWPEIKEMVKLKTFPWKDK